MTSYLEACQTEFWKNVFEQEMNYILNVLKDHKEILSVGCGPAIIESGLQEYGFQVTGLDVSKEALEGAPDSIRTVIGSAEDMEFSNESFDAVIYVTSLQFINNYEKAVKQTVRVLIPGGVFLTMLLNPSSEYFKDNTKDPKSYMSMIKHPEIAPIEKVIAEYFTFESEYYLGIKGQEIFPSSDPKLASLYIIHGKRNLNIT